MITKRKNKKFVLIGFTFAAILLLGFTLNLLGNIVPRVEMYDVAVNYNIVSCDGKSETFDTFSKKYEKGERVRIPIPVIEGYRSVSQYGVSLDDDLILIVKSDINYTINYVCSGKDRTYSSIEYPVDGNPGMCIAECKCGYTWDYQFTSLTQQIIFGGDVINTIAYGYKEYDGYLLATNDDCFVKLADAVPEFKNIEEAGVTIVDKNTLNGDILVSLEYDESVWGKDAITFKRNVNDSAESKYSISIGGNYRIKFKFEDMSGITSLLEWAQDENCPLVTSPIKVIVTYDFTK